MVSQVIPTYINEAKTDNTIRVFVQAQKNRQHRTFDILLDAGSPIKPRLEQLLKGWQICDWMPDGVF